MSSGVGSGSSRTSASVHHASASSFLASCSGPLAAHVGMAGERGVGPGDVIARFARERLGRVVLAAMRRADRRRARLDRLARRADRDLAGAVLLLERLARRVRRSRRSPRADPPRGYDDALRAQRELGHAQLRHVPHLVERVRPARCAPTPTARRTRPRATSTKIWSAHVYAGAGSDREEQGARARPGRAPGSTSRRRFADRWAAAETGGRPSTGPATAGPSRRSAASVSASGAAGRRRSPRDVPLVRPSTSSL